MWLEGSGRMWKSYMALTCSKRLHARMGPIEFGIQAVVFVEPSPIEHVLSQVT